MAEKLHKGSLFLTDYAEIVTGICETNPEAGDRFCDAVERALELLSDHPQAGSKAGFQHAPKVRKWVIQPFPNYLIFYEDRTDGILLIRLLHGARELPPLIPPA